MGIVKLDFETLAEMSVLGSSELKKGFLQNVCLYAALLENNV